MRKEEREDIMDELAMVLCHIDGLYWNDLTLTEASDYKKKTELVCLKVDRELPKYVIGVNATNETAREIAEEAQRDMLKAGYVAFEPLI